MGASMIAMETVQAATTPRIVSRMPWDEYAALRCVSITQLKELARSPKHYKYRLSHPKESASLELGKTTHMSILEPERFRREHVVWETTDASGKARIRRGKAWEEFLSEAGSRRVITAPEWELACAMRDAVHDHPDARRYLQAGDPEVSMQWVTDGNMPAKGRVDWLTTEPGSNAPLLVGLKTTRDCREIQFGNQAARLFYHMQWAFYCDGYHAITGKRARVVEIAVEVEPPHDVAVYTVPLEILEQGRAEYQRLLGILSQCKRDGEWPGAVPNETVLTLPTWAYPTGDDDITDLGLESA